VQTLIGVCVDAGDDEKAEEELEVETPRKTAPKAASPAIAGDLFTSADIVGCNPVMTLLLTI